MKVMLALLAALLGLLFGSLVDRVVVCLPRNIPLFGTGPRCPACGAPLRWWEGLPLVACLRRRCRHCDKPRPLRAAGVELCNGGLWLAAALVYLEDDPLYALGVMLFCSLSLCIGLIDFDTMYIHDSLLWLLLLPDLMILVAHRDHALDHALGALIGGGSFLLFYVLFRLLRGKEAMGVADIVLMALLGAALGSAATLFAILLASLGGCLVLIPRRRREAEAPFAPFLTLGAMLALFLAQPVLEAYLGLFGL